MPSPWPWSPLTTMAMDVRAATASSTYPAPAGGARGLQEDASGFAPAVLVGLDSPPTMVLPSGWGSLKRLMVW